MKKHYKYVCLALALLLLPGCGRGAGVAVRAGKAPQAEQPGSGPHAAAPLSARTKPLVRSGWLELFFDDASKGMSIRSHGEEGAEWSVLGREGSKPTPKADAGACAVEAEICVNGHILTLNSQDHSVAYGNAASWIIMDDGELVDAENYASEPAGTEDDASEPAGTEDDDGESASAEDDDGEPAATEDDAGEPAATEDDVISQNINGDDKKPVGVEVAFTLTPDADAADRAANKKLKPDDVAFLVRVRYTLVEGNLHVQANWENLNQNPNAFIAALGLMERFGALKNPGPEDFFLLPDGCGALLYPARSPAADQEDLRFAVYGNDPSLPAGGSGGDAGGTRGDVALRANVAAWGVRGPGATGQGAGFVAVAEQGAALCEIVARQSIPGEVSQSAVGPRFTVTPVAVDAKGLVTKRAPASYGGAKGEAFSITYRFFYGDSANFSTMATACREQLISTGLLSSTKFVSDTGLVPMELTLLGMGPAWLGQKKLTTYAQAQDILTRLKSKGVDSMNVRYQSALRGGWLQKAPERLSPLRRLGGTRELEALQKDCRSKGFTLFPDVRVYSAKGGLFVPGANDIAGRAIRRTPRGFPWDISSRTLPLRAVSSFTRASRAILVRLGKLEIGGVSLGGVGSTLYADYAGGGVTRTETAERMDRLLPAFSARWSVMMESGDFYVVRHADVIVNLPLETQLQMPGDRYVPVPLLPILLHSSADYSGAPLNLLDTDNRDAALLRSISWGACPAFTWTADERGSRDKRLDFEAQIVTTPKNGANPELSGSQLDFAASAYERANTALWGLRSARITDYTVDPVTGVAVTSYSNDAKVYVNFGDKPQVKDEITIPPMDFKRIG